MSSSLCCSFRERLFLISTGYTLVYSNRSAGFSSNKSEIKSYKKQRNFLFLGFSPCSQVLWRLVYDCGRTKMPIAVILNLLICSREFLRKFCELLPLFLTTYEYFLWLPIGKFPSLWRNCFCFLIVTSLETHMMLYFIAKFFNLIRNIFGNFWECREYFRWNFFAFKLKGKFALLFLRHRWMSNASSTQWIFPRSLK